MNKNVITFVIITSIIIIFFAFLFNHYLKLFKPDHVVTEDFKVCLSDSNLDNTIPTMGNPDPIQLITVAEDRIEEQIITLQKDIIKEFKTINFPKNKLPFKTGTLNNLTLNFWVNLENVTSDATILDIVQSREITIRKNMIIPIPTFPFVIVVPTSHKQTVYDSYLKVRTKKDETSLHFSFNLDRDFLSIHDRIVVKGRWANICIVCEGLNLSVYVNGELKGSYRFRNNSNGFAWPPDNDSLKLRLNPKVAGSTPLALVKYIQFAVKPEFIVDYLAKEAPQLPDNRLLNCYNQHPDKTGDELLNLCAPDIIPTVPNSFPGIRMDFNSQRWGTFTYNPFSYKMIENKIVILSGLLRYVGNRKDFIITENFSHKPTKNLIFVYGGGARTPEIRFDINSTRIMATGMPINQPTINFDGVYYSNASLPLHITNTSNIGFYGDHLEPRFTKTDNFVFLSGLIRIQNFKNKLRRNERILITRIPSELYPLFPEKISKVLRWRASGYPSMNGIFELHDNQLYFKSNQLEIDTTNTWKTWLTLNNINWVWNQSATSNKLTIRNSTVLKEISNFDPLPDGLKATIYDTCDYKGNSQDLFPGHYNINDIKLKNDTISSIKIPYGLRVTLYENKNFGFTKTRVHRFGENSFTNDISCLTDHIMKVKTWKPLFRKRRWENVSWNDQASSIVVTQWTEGPIYRHKFETDFEPKYYKMGDFVKLTGCVVIGGFLFTFSKDIMTLPEEIRPNRELKYEFFYYTITIKPNGVVSVVSKNFNMPERCVPLDDIVYWTGVNP